MSIFSRASQNVDQIIINRPIITPKIQEELDEMERKWNDFIGRPKRIEEVDVEFDRALEQLLQPNIN